LTARAPQQPQDNPFLEREYVVSDPATGARRTVKMRPIELVSSRTKDMYASDRYVPGITDENEARALGERAAREGTDAPMTAERTRREQEVLGSPEMRQAHEDPTQLKPTPKSTGAPPPPETAPPTVPAASPVPPVAGQLEGRPGAADSTEEAESWVEPPEAPGEVLQGSLGGDEGPGEDQGDPTLPQPGDAVHATPQAVPETVGAQLGAEEHAKRVDPSVGEETGAAKPPAEPQPEGEYASAEEVGSPGAPEADDDDSAGLIGG
jgi:hypothetical protein